MGAVSFANITQSVVGDKRAVVADVTFSSSYATGGDTVTLSSLGLNEVDQVLCDSGYLAPTLASKKFTPVTHGTQVILSGTPKVPTLMAVTGATGSAGAEAAAASNLTSRGAVRCWFLGS